MSKLISLILTVSKAGLVVKKLMIQPVKFLSDAECLDP